MSPVSDAVVSRRGMLTLAGAALLASRSNASDSGFWNAKPPADWTPEEIDSLLKDSPWAKEITPTYTSLPPAPGTRPWSENPPIGGGSLPPSPIPAGPSPRQRPFKAPYKATIRWESAEPIRSAQKIALPAAFRNRYVLGVYFPNPKDLGSKPVENLKESAVLQSRRALDAEIVQVHPQIQDGFLIGFPKTAALGGKELVFSARVGRLELKARFNPDEMRYHGQLAL